MPKYNVRRKAQLGLDIREGGIAIPIAPNMYYMDGRSHDEGGIGIGPNNKNGLEVEGGEIVKVGDNDIKVFSSVPLLQGASPAQLVLGGANPNKVFAAQEEFKDRNRINDDGTRYEAGGEKKIYEMPFAQRVQYARTGKITNTGYPVTPLQKGYSTLRALGRFRTAIKDRPWRLDEAFNSAIKGAMNDAAKTPVGWDKQYNNKGLQFIKAVYNRIVGNKGQNLGITKYETEDKQMKAGGIYIKPSKRGTFTTAAKKRGMGVQEFASKVLANKEDYSPAMVKKANFARNANHWKKELGGNMIYEINGNVKNGLMSARPKAKYGKIDRKNKDEKVGPDGLIYKRAADGEWHTDGTKHVTARPIVKNSRNDLVDINNGLMPTIIDRNGHYVRVKSIVPKDKKIITRKFDKPKRTYVGGYDEEEKETKKIGSLTYEKNESGKWVPSVKQSTTTTRDGGKPKDFGMTRTGVNHPNGNYKYHLLTGEKISEMGVVEASEPSVKGTTKVISKPSSTGRGKEAKAATPKAASKSAPTVQDIVNKITTDAWKASKTPKIDLSKVEMPSYNVSDLSSKETKADKAKLNTSSTGGGTKSKDGRWIGQYKTTNVGDWIGLGSNLAGSVASYFMTKNAINKTPEPIKPVMAQATKLKTRYNVEPQLTELREAEQMNRAAVRRNTQSSNTSLAREQRLMNEARGARNTLYGHKENIETQLINQDRLNRQSVMRDNIRAYNEYLNRVTATRQGQNQLRISNINNFLSGLTGSVNNILGTIESRKATNNTLRAIAAANPNVDARLIGGFDYYIDPITKRKYNKNQQYIGTIND